MGRTSFHPKKDWTRKKARSGVGLKKWPHKQVTCEKTSSQPVNIERGSDEGKQLNPPNDLKFQPVSTQKICNSP